MTGRRVIGSGLCLLAIATLLVGALAWLGYFARDPVTMFRTSGQDERNKPVAALFLSGDMGLKMGMGPKVTAAMAAWGVPVVGVSSLAFFRHQRSAAEITAMIARGIDRARKLGRTDSVILVGQSFGADMLHVGLAGLSPAQRKYVRMVILIIPTEPVYRQVTLGEFSGLAPGGEDAMKTASQLRWVPVLCIFGAEESDSVCPALTMPNVRRIALPGGHRLRFDAGRLNRVVRWAIDQNLKREGA